MKDNNLHIDKLENRICLDATPVMGPDIPDSLDYLPPPALMRSEALPADLVASVNDLIANTPTQELTHPIPDNGVINREYIWDQGLDDLFRAYAEDGEITTREARDIVVQNDDGGYISRFEVWQTMNYLYDVRYQDLYSRQSQVFMLLALSDNAESLNAEGIDTDADYLREGVNSVQAVADAWFNIARQSS